MCRIYEDGPLLDTYKKEARLNVGRFRADDELRPITETLLRIGVHSSSKAFRAGKTSVVWYDRQGDWVGQGKISACGPNEFAMDLITDSLHEVLSSIERVEFEMAKVQHGGYRRASFACPVCYSLVDKLLRWKHTWACGKCHDVVNISSRLSTLQRNYIRYLALKQKTGEERASGQWQASFDRDYNKLCRLDRYWSSRSEVTLPLILQTMIHERYFSPRCTPDINEREDGCLPETG